jgi:branched-subunit amino acid aminotransferase/4-amino-4-deoxychorismate lyase
LDNVNDSPIFNFAIVNGERRPVDKALVSIFNKAIFASFGVYEAVKIRCGRPFYLEEHLHRLRQSADLIDLQLDVDGPTLNGLVKQLCQLDPEATWRLLIIAFGSIEVNDRPIIAMRAEPLPTYPDRLYQAGAQAILYEGQRAMPACKSLNTLVNFLARRAATRSGALEGLLHHNGHLTEGARSNLFAVRAGRLMTPPAGEVLSGITRDIIVQVMAETAYPVQEARLSTDLSLYDEFFISSTSMHVMPITQIDGRPVGAGQVGPVTKLAMERFEAHYRQVMEAA